MSWPWCSVSVAGGATRPSRAGTRPARPRRRRSRGPRPRRRAGTGCARGTRSPTHARPGRRSSSCALPSVRRGRRSRSRLAAAAGCWRRRRVPDARERHPWWQRRVEVGGGPRSAASSALRSSAARSAVRGSTLVSRGRGAVDDRGLDVDRSGAGVPDCAPGPYRSAHATDVAIVACPQNGTSAIGLKYRASDSPARERRGTPSRSSRLGCDRLHVLAGEIRGVQDHTGRVAARRIRTERGVPQNLHARQPRAAAPVRTRANQPIAARRAACGPRPPGLRPPGLRLARCAAARAAAGPVVAGLTRLRWTAPGFAPSTGPNGGRNGAVSLDPDAKPASWRSSWRAVGAPIRPGPRPRTSSGRAANRGPHRVVSVTLFEPVRRGAAVVRRSMRRRRSRCGCARARSTTSSASGTCSGRGARCADSSTRRRAARR